MKIEALINRYYDGLTANDRYICECILNNKSDCTHLSIDAFAYKYHVSTSTLSRFAQKLKLPGYSELRAIVRFGEGEVDARYQSIENMMDCYQKVINDIDTKDCSVLFERMQRADRIIIFGEGYSQGRVAKEMKRIFLPAGKKMYDAYGYDMITPLVNFIKPEDMIVFISLKGEAPEVVDFAKAIKMKGVYSVSITKMVSSALSRLCDENLYIQSISLPIDANLEYEGTTPYFILIELLYIKYKMYFSGMNILP